MKKVGTLLLSLLMVVSLCNHGIVIAVEEIEQSIAVKLETKVYSSATMEDDFSDDTAIVVLTNQESLKLKEYSVADFSEIDCFAVTNLTQTSTNIAASEVSGEEYELSVAAEEDHVTFTNIRDVELTTFNIILSLTLKEPGKQNVLNAISILQKRSDVKYAGPDYLLSIDQTVPNDAFYLNQRPSLVSIDLPQAWDYCTGNMTVEVGVIDTGIQASHPDLDGRVDVTKSRNFSNYPTISPLEAAEDGHGHGVSAGRK